MANALLFYNKKLNFKLLIAFFLAVNFNYLCIKLITHAVNHSRYLSTNDTERFSFIYFLESKRALAEAMLRNAQLGSVRLCKIFIPESTFLRYLKQSSSQKFCAYFIFFRVQQIVLNSADNNS